VVIMAIRIEDVKLTTSYSWQDIKNQADWNAVKNTNLEWKQPLQTAIAGQQVKIEVEIIENSWSGIKEDHSTWQKIKEKFVSWLEVKNY